MAEVFARSAKWDSLKIAAEMTIMTISKRPGSRQRGSEQ
jgi:hypothetical protein